MMIDGDGDGLDVYWEYVLGTNPIAQPKGVIEASADFDGDSSATAGKSRAARIRCWQTRTRRRCRQPRVRRRLRP